MRSGFAVLKMLEAGHEFEGSAACHRRRIEPRCRRFSRERLPLNRHVAGAVREHQFIATDRFEHTLERELSAVSPGQTGQRRRRGDEQPGERADAVCVVSVTNSARAATRTWPRYEALVSAGLPAMQRFLEPDQLRNVIDVDKADKPARLRHR